MTVNASTQNSDYSAQSASAQSASAQSISAHPSSAGAQSRSGDPQEIASRIMQRNEGPLGPDIAGIRSDLAAVEMQAPDLAREVRALLEARLTTVERGQLARSDITITAASGETMTYSEGGMTLAQQYDAPAGSPARMEYERRDSLFGDGNPATPDFATIANAERAAIAAQMQIGAAAPAAAAANENGPDTARLVADLTQMGIDIVGIVDPTGLADGANAFISLGRAGLSLWNGRGGEALGHLGNGALSAVSILPLGDLAKAGKIGKWADTVSDAIGAAARNPLVKEAVTPMLREISANLSRIPQGVIDALPQGAQDSIARMETQLDGFFGAGTRAADDVAQAGTRLVGNTLVLDANRGATFTAGGRTQAIGDTASITPRSDGRQLATDVNGDAHLVRHPTTANYDSRVANPDGSVVYARDGRSVTYDSDGFPVFAARADLYLDASAINSGSDAAHFREANRMIGEALQADPSLARQIGLNADQVAFLTRDTPSGRSPPDLTWHHHQDTGRMQLVDAAVHDHFSGGHTGGMRLWGGGR